MSEKIRCFNSEENQIKYFIPETANDQNFQRATGYYPVGEAEDTEALQLAAAEMKKQAEEARKLQPLPANEIPAGEEFNEEEPETEKNDLIQTLTKKIYDDRKKILK